MLPTIINKQVNTQPMNVLAPARPNAVTMRPMSNTYSPLIPHQALQQSQYGAPPLYCHRGYTLAEMEALPESMLSEDCGGMRVTPAACAYSYSPVDNRNRPVPPPQSTGSGLGGNSNRQLAPLPAQTGYQYAQSTPPANTTMGANWNRLYGHGGSHSGSN